MAHHLEKLVSRFDLFEVENVADEEDQFGLYKHVHVLGWESLQAKQDKKGVDLNIRGRNYKAQLANNFKVRYQWSGNSRVVTRTLAGVVEGQTTTGWEPLVDPDRLVEPTWIRESFVRDETAEINACVQRFLDRIAASSDYQEKVRREPDRQGTTLNLQVGAGNGDAHELDSGTGFDGTGTTIRIDSSTAAGSRYNAGFLFSSVAVPASATIDSATISFWLSGTSFDDANFDIHFEDVDNTADFTTTADVTSRTRTTASDPWVQDSVGAGAFFSKACTTSAAEALGRAGWSSGNNLCAIVVGRSDLIKYFFIHSYENDSTHAAKLDIDYTEGGGGGGGGTTHISRPLLGVG